MLVEFRVKNFKSFRDEQTLSLVASADKSLLDNTTLVEALGKRRLLNSVVVYGANASGKSNLMAAIDFMQDFVATSATRPQGQRVPVQRFRLAEAYRQMPSKFETTFIQEGVRYQYGFTVDPEQVHNEWLIAYPRGRSQIWFERVAHPRLPLPKWYFGPNLKGEKSRLADLTRDDVLFLSIAAQFNHAQLTPVYEWFAKNLYVLNVDTDFALMEEATSRTVHEFVDLREWLASLLRMADVGIVDLSTASQPLFGEGFGNTIPDNFKPVFDALHRVAERAAEQRNVEAESITVSMFHSVGSDGNPVPFELHDESLGTRKLFTLSVPVFITLTKGDVLVVDELDSSLHTILVRIVTKLFHKPEVNQNGAQLIFNTHDVAILDSNLFRRDQVWFTEKDNSGATKLYSLLEYKPRKSEALGKNYLQGQYGAVPIIDDLLLELEPSAETAETER